MAKDNTRIKSLAQALPQTKEQVVELIARIGTLDRERRRIQAAMNDELAALKQRWEEKAEPLGEEIKALQVQVQAWCEAHRAELTDNGKVKTVALASGEVRWRTSPPRVQVRSLDTVLSMLRRLGLTQFIRVKEELNKEAILAEASAVAGIKGITIKQDETFEVIPFEQNLASA